MAKPINKAASEAERDAFWARKQYNVEQEEGEQRLLRQIFNHKLSSKEFERLMAETVEQYGDNR